MSELLDIENLSKIDKPALFDPRIMDGTREKQQIWTTETVELARKGLVEGFQLRSSPFLKTVKDVMLRKANIPFKMSEDDMESFDFSDYNESVGKGKE